MKRLLLLLPLVFIGTMACADTVTEPELVVDQSALAPAMAESPEASGRVMEMITGAGHYVTRPPSLNPGVWRTFSMTAAKKADGSVRGSFQRVVHPEGGPAETAHGTITCFTIVGNTAWIGGHNPDSSPSDLVWQVVDNGEGPGDPPDLVGLQIEAATFGFPAGLAEEFCRTTPTMMDFGPPFGVLPISLVLTPVEGGDIQIKVK